MFASASASAVSSMFGDRRSRKELGAIALLSLGLRLAILGRGLTLVDRLFIPDDSYYTLAIARSLAHGHGPAADGVTLTSGFQPLIAFLLTPVFWLTSSLDVPVYASCALGSLADAASAFLLGCLALRLSGRPAAFATTLLWALSPVAISNALNGLETSLALSLELLLILIWDAPELDSSSARSRWLALRGLLVGLTLLARIDAVFLICLLGVSDVWRRRWRGVAISAATAALTVAPWWGYCLVHFGSPVPSSGDAVWHLLESHRQHYLTPPFAIGWAVGTLLTSPLAELPRLRQFVSADELLALGLFSAYVLGIVLATRRQIIKREGWLDPAVCFSMFSVALVFFYACYLPALWFFRRYLAPVHAFQALIVGLLFGAMSTRVEVAAKRAAQACAGVAGLLLVAMTGAFFREPSGTVDVGLHGAKGYAEPARQVLAKVPRCAVLGALQSGALSYFADGCPLVVGLDGVVDPAAARALRDGTLSSYAAARGVTYFADWAYNRQAFAFFSSFAKVKPIGARPIAATKAQGSDRFEVFELEWPPNARLAKPSAGCCLGATSPDE